MFGARPATELASRSMTSGVCGQLGDRLVRDACRLARVVELRGEPRRLGVERDGGAPIRRRLREGGCRRLDIDRRLGKDLELEFEQRLLLQRQLGLVASQPRIELLADRLLAKRAGGLFLIVER